MTRSRIRSFIFGAVCMLALLSIIVHNGEPYKQYARLKELTEQCEQSLPRNEFCVIIVVPESKD